jgi:hypothetical protein
VRGSRTHIACEQGVLLEAAAGLEGQLECVRTWCALVVPWWPTAGCLARQAALQCMSGYVSAEFESLKHFERCMHDGPACRWCMLF